MAMLVAPYNSAMRLGMGFNSFTQQLCINDAVRPASKVSAANAESKYLRPTYKLGLMGDDGPLTTQEVTWTAKFVDRISEVTDSMNISGALEIKCDAIGGGGGASASFIDSNKFKESDINYHIQVKVVNQQLEAPDLTEFCPIDHVPPSQFTSVYGDSFISGFVEGGEFNAVVSIRLKDRSKAKEIKGDLKIDLEFTGASVHGKASGGKKDLSSETEGETTIAVHWTGGGDIKDATVRDWTLESLKSVAMEFPEHVMACPIRTSAILTKYTSLRSFHEKTTKGTPLDYENAGVYSSALLDAYLDYKVMWRYIQNAIWEVEQGQSEVNAKVTVPELKDMAKQANETYKKRLEYYEQISKRHADREAEEEAQIAQLQANTPPSAPLPPPTTAVSTALAAPPQADEADTDSASTSSDFAEISASQSLDTSPPTQALIPQPHTPSPPAAPIVRFSRSKLPPIPSRPLPPNDFDAYRATIFGLEKARTDCRFEMIKIVREVDEVANDPKVASDPDRNWQYTAPSIFRMLLPTVRNLDREKAKEKAEAEAKLIAQDKDTKFKATEQTLASTQGELASAKAELVRLKEQLATSNTELEKGKQRLTELESFRISFDPYADYCPVTPNTIVFFENVLAKKNMDNVFHRGQPGLWDQCRSPEQKFMITRGPRHSYYIRFTMDDSYIYASHYGPDERLYLKLGPVPSEFVFEPAGDGAVYIRLASRPQYSMNPEGAASRNETPLIMWPHAVGASAPSDKWYIRN